jgi:hypothetical protein
MAGVLAKAVVQLEQGRVLTTPAAPGRSWSPGVDSGGAHAGR